MMMRPMSADSRRSPYVLITAAASLSPYPSVSTAVLILHPSYLIASSPSTQRFQHGCSCLRSRLLSGQLLRLLRMLVSNPTTHRSPPRPPRTPPSPSLLSSPSACCLSFVQNTCSSVGRKGSLFPYFLLLFVTSVIAFVLRFWGGPLVINLTVTSLTLCSADSSLPCYGFGALTRISFSLTLFFLLHLLLPSLSRLSWWVKLSCLLALVVGCWFIPDSFYTVYVDIARFFSGLFLLLQLVILVDFAYSWQEAWTSDERPWHRAVIAVSLASFTACLVLLVYLFQWFSSSSCRLETFLISFTLVLTTLTSALSISPFIEGGGLLPAAVVTLYSFYLLFSALSSDPSSCNGLYGAGGSATSQKATIWQTVINILITAASVGYAAYNVYTSSTLIGEGGGGDEAAGEAPGYASIEEGKEEGKAAAEAAPAAAPAASEVEVVSDKQYRRFYLVMGVTSMYLSAAAAPRARPHSLTCLPSLLLSC